MQWTAISSGLMALIWSTGSLGAPPLPESSNSEIGYPTVEAAMRGLRAQDGIEFSTQNDWMIATDEAHFTVWSFAPRSHPSFPSVVKRQVISNGNGSIIDMKVHCEASKSVCDDLVRTFAEMSGIRLPQ